jgi:hypothetical protein
VSAVQSSALSREVLNKACSIGALLSGRGSTVVTAKSATDGGEERMA